VRREPAGLDPKPYLLHLPGVGGTVWLHRDYLAALDRGGFDAEMEIVDWRRRRFPIAALQDYDANRAAAAEVARDITDRRRAEPDRPIYLSAESGGAGIAAWVLEALPDDVQVDAALLISPALSPDYDLSAALRHVRTRMFVFTSRNDALVLGLGTSLFGTMDGKKRMAAGMVGFRQPPDADPGQYAKLEQHPFEAGWFLAYGQLGGHASALGARFASARIAPMLVAIARETPVQQAAVQEPPCSCHWQLAASALHMGSGHGDAASATTRPATAAVGGGTINLEATTAPAEPTASVERTD
jgi:hypothetical protein